MTAKSETHPALVFAAIFLFIFLLHAPLLRLPYFWDEAGYYIPAARDLLLSGSVIPHSTVSNAHPPLVLAWLALWWKIVGFAPIVTRTAMLVVAAFSQLGLFRLAERVANTNVAIASTLCTALYPVFFAQSSLAHVDLASAGLIFWALSAYVEDEFIAAGVWFALAALAKETAIIAPLALAAWACIGLIAGWHSDLARKNVLRRIASLLLAAAPLALWYVYHYRHTGHVFGNPEFFRYNVAATLSPLRFVLALGMRLWQVVAYLHLWFLTLATLAAMWILPPLDDCGAERPRITFAVQMIFYTVVAAYVLTMALIGGAVLARYMLPAVPLVILVCVSTLWRRVSFWRAAMACVALAFVAGWFLNPHYGFSPEDNLAYRDYILLHEDGEHFLEARYPMARVLTAWPASDEIRRPWLGYITRPMHVVRIENFSLDEVLSAAELRSNDAHSNYEVALIFSTKYEPGPAAWDRWQEWNEWKSRFFDFHRDVPPAAAAQILGGHVVFYEARQGQWIAVIEMERNGIESARATTGKDTSGTRAFPRLSR
ncbi:MAG: ArnT family glycosyltransferase [Candidatus Sulfotelmatobacter sp.]